MAAYLLVLGTALLLCVYKLRHFGRRPKGFPPGPPTLPLIGNLHQMAKNDPHIQLKKWADEYGPIYSLILGTKTMIVLSSDHVVKDLLDKRSSIYSSRPEMFLGQTIASGGLRMVLMEYGSVWRMMRKLFHSLLNVNVAKTYVPYQDLESKQMLVGFLEQPDLFIGHLRRYTNSLTTQIVFGFRTTSIDDPKLKRLYDGVEKWSEAASAQAAALLDVFPILRSLPRAMLPLLKYAENLHIREKDLYVGHWMEAKNKFKDGTAKPCFCSGLVKAQKTEGFSDDLAGYISGTALEAGSDTTASTLLGFVQAMLLHPEVQKMAQGEIDQVCGDDRLPSMEDEPRMPYIRGCVKESLRWMPTAIMGIPHSVIRDDEYMGYRIPKAAIVVLNVWAIHTDPSRYSNPYDFDPSRYSNDTQSSAEAAANPDVSKRDQFVFGAGRRLCQGMHIADRSLFLAISRLLWAFNLEQVDGMAPDRQDLTQGLIVQPHGFPIRITPRSAKRAAIVQSAWADCKILLDQNQQWKSIPEGMKFYDYDSTVESKA